MKPFDQWANELADHIRAKETKKELVYVGHLYERLLKEVPNSVPFWSPSGLNRKEIPHTISFNQNHVGKSLMKEYWKYYYETITVPASKNLEETEFETLKKLNSLDWWWLKKDGNNES